MKHQNWLDRSLVGIFFAIIAFFIFFDLIVARHYSPEAPEPDTQSTETPAPATVTPSANITLTPTPAATPTASSPPRTAPKQSADTPIYKGKIVITNFKSGAIYVVAEQKGKGFKSKMVKIYPGPSNQVSMQVPLGTIQVTAYGSLNGDFLQGKVVELTGEIPKKPVYFP